MKPNNTIDSVTNCIQAAILLIIRLSKIHHSKLLKTLDINSGKTKNLNKKLKKAYFCFSITSSSFEGIKLLYWTVLLIFYSRYFQNKLIKNNTVSTLTIKTHQGKINIKMRLQDIAIFHEVFFEQVYTIPTQPEESGNIIDIGAHIGLASIYIWDHYFPKGSFYLVEPSTKNFELLEYNTTSLNRILIKKAVSHFNGIAKLSTQGFGYNHKIETINRKNTQATEVSTINDIIENMGIEFITLCKIDVEGEEENIMKHNCTWIHRTNILLMELHNEFDESLLKAILDSFGIQFIASQYSKASKVICMKFLRQNDYLTPEK